MLVGDQKVLIPDLNRLYPVRPIEVGAEATYLASGLSEGH
jgi:hypothetical protein